MIYCLLSCYYLVITIINWILFLAQNVTDTCILAQGFLEQLKCFLRVLLQQKGWKPLLHCSGGLAETQAQNDNLFSVSDVCTSLRMQQAKLETDLIPNAFSICSSISMSMSLSEPAALCWKNLIMCPRLLAEIKKADNLPVGNVFFCHPIHCTEGYLYGGLISISPLINLRLKDGDSPK